MIQIIKADGAAELALIDNLRTRAAEIGEEIDRTAAPNDGGCEGTGL